MKLSWAAACTLGFLALAWLGVRSVPARAEGSRHASITEGLDCSLCHTPAGWKSLSDTGAKGFDHAKTGFPLTARHAHVPCTGCHHASEKVTRACAGCHRDAHESRLGTDCSECHSALSWNNVRSFERHRLTRLPLTGMHALLECTQCHRRTTGREWSSVPADCYACHERDYRRADIHPLHLGGVGDPPSRAFPRDCAQCHRADAFSPAIVNPNALRDLVVPSVNGLTRAPLIHDALFPLQQGRHRGLACDDCHKSERVPQAVRCSGCHAHNPVTLQTQHRKLAATPNEGSCLACHRGGIRR
jgi:hypothetical protein